MLQMKSCVIYFQKLTQEKAEEELERLKNYTLNTKIFTYEDEKLYLKLCKQCQMKHSAPEEVLL